MTTEAAVKKLLAEAEWHRSQGRWDVGHEYQRHANELSRLASMAKRLPRRPKPKVDPHVAQLQAEIAYKRKLRNDDLTS